MTTAKDLVLAPVAVAALVEAVMHGTAYSWWQDRPSLSFHAGNEALTRALLAVLTEVGAEDWDGPDSGDGLRTYRGLLPCGLPVEITTYRDEVPDLLADRAQAKLDSATEDAGPGDRS